MTTESILQPSPAVDTRVPNILQEPEAFAEHLKLAIEQTTNMVQIELQALGKKIDETKRVADATFTVVEEVSEKGKPLETDDARSVSELRIDEMFDEIRDIVERARKATKELCENMPRPVRRAVTAALAHAYHIASAFVFEKVRQAGSVTAAFAGTIFDIFLSFWKKVKECVQLANGALTSHSIQHVMAEAIPMSQIPT